MSKNLSIPDFQTTIDGKSTDLFFIENRHGVRAAITNYGARVVAIWVPDRNGDPDNIVAGYDSIAGYLNHQETYLGAMIGRYANRIKDASFELDGKSYKVTANEGRHHIHGGETGFHNMIWEVKQMERDCVKLKLESADRQEGFPGNIEVEVSYTFSDDDELIIESEATTDRDTILNITNHCYFNLSGETNCRPARNHKLMINADNFLPVDKDKIPLGKKESVTDSPFDFRKYRVIEEQLETEHCQLEIGEGFDHNFVLNKSAENTFVLAARARDPSSGRVLEMHTTEPGLQFFECEFPKELDLNLGTAFCLEPQHFPDSPNRSHFPSTVLRAGEQFYSKSMYCFRTDS